MTSSTGGSPASPKVSWQISIPDGSVVRATIVHLTNSGYGATSAPLGFRRPDKGLTQAGRDIIVQMNARRMFVDLAHIHEQGFWDAVAVHDKTQPLIVTQTGVAGVKPHWRNLTDAQVKAVYLGHGEGSSDAGPPQGARAPLGGSEPRAAGSVGAGGSHV